MGDYKLRQLIQKKRDGKSLCVEDIEYFVDAAKRSIRCHAETNQEGSVDRCQIGAMLMAIYLKGLSESETKQLTLKMRDSGYVFDWPIEQKVRIVDKHSTGGVGDKTSLILVPALAVCDLLIPMISGRSLSHTGGTLDKLEAIKQFSVFLDDQEIKNAINSVGCCIVGQTDDCVPADKVLYKCRDITATVDYPPLIIASIVSKKLSENPNALVYDVKFGRGSCFKSKEEALKTAQELIKASRPVKAIALLTSMEVPLGRAIGDSLEVLEAIECLKGEGPKDVLQLVEALGHALLRLTEREEKYKISETLRNGKALKKFHDMIIQQKVSEKTAHDLCYGDASKALRKQAPYITKLSYTGEKGYVSSIDPLVLGNVWKEEYNYSNRNSGIGFLLLKTVGDKIESGESWIKFHHQRQETTFDQKRLLSSAIQISSEKVERKLIESIVYFKGDSLVVEDY